MPRPQKFAEARVFVEENHYDRGTTSLRFHRCFSFKVVFFRRTDEHWMTAYSTDLFYRSPREWEITKEEAADPKTAVSRLLSKHIGPFLSRQYKFRIEHVKTF